MQNFLLILLSVSILRVIWLFLSAAFRCIEKAHEHLRETEPRTNGAELVRERAG